MNDDNTPPPTANDMPREMVKVIPEKNGAEPKPAPPKAAEAKGKAGELPKKPAKKVAKSWPYVNALLTTLSLTATLSGWAHFTVQEMRRAEAEAAAWVASQAAVAPAAPSTPTPAPAYTLELPPIPTVVPAQTFTLNGGVGTTAAVTAPPAPVAAPAVVAPAPAAPALRSVAAPPPVVSAPAPAAPVAPAPVAATGSSRR